MFPELAAPSSSTTGDDGEEAEYTCVLKEHRLFLARRRTGHFDHDAEIRVAVKEQAGSHQTRLPWRQICDGCSGADAIIRFRTEAAASRLFPKYKREITMKSRINSDLPALFNMSSCCFSSRGLERLGATIRIYCGKVPAEARAIRADRRRDAGALDPVIFEISPTKDGYKLTPEDERYAESTAITRIRGPSTSPPRAPQFRMFLNNLRGCAEEISPVVRGYSF